MRHRKRPNDDELLTRVNAYEELLRQNNIPFSPYDSSWIPSSFQSKVENTHQVTSNALVDSISRQDDADLRERVGNR